MGELSGLSVRRNFSSVRGFLFSVRRILFSGRRKNFSGRRILKCFFLQGSFFFFCLDTKEERNKKKKSRLRLRGCCGTAGSAVETKLAALRQRFALAARLVPPLDASPPRPFFCSQRRCAVCGRWLGYTVVAWQTEHCDSPARGIFSPYGGYFSLYRG